MARVNLCPNPALKNNDDYPNGSQAFFGGGVRVTGVANMPRTTGYRTTGAESTLPRCTVTAGTTYRFSASVKGDGASHTGAQGNINWYSNGSYLTSSPGTAFSVTDGQVTRCDSGAYAAPAGADEALLNITGLDGGAIVTAILYSPSASLLEYFDGDSTDATWTGTSGNSTSTTTVGDDGEQPPPPDPGGGGGGGGSGTGDPNSAGTTQGWGTPFVFDDFDTYGTNIAAVPLSRYNGPGHVGNGLRRPERWSVGDSILRITGLAGSPNTGGGATEYANGDRQYGRWEIRMRAYNAGGGSGDQYHPVMIIWPSSEQWPDDGEYDFQEGDVGDTAAGAFIHYPHPNLPVQQEHAVMSGIAMSDWHNYAFQWLSTGVSGYIDGRSWYAFSGGGGPSGRRNIQTMPQGSLRLQMDAFSGSSHRGAQMDFDWVKIWTQDSVVTDTGITATGIASAESFGTTTIGNRFRLYLNNTTASTTTALSPPWDQTSGSVTGQALGLGRAGTNTSVTVIETSTSNVFDVAMGQWISEPMTSGGVLKGGFGYVTARLESNTAADLISHAVIKVVSGDGTTVRGIAADLITPVEWSTTLQATSVSSTITNPVTCLTGDRLVVELGYRATNVVATSYSGTLRYGGTGDLESGDTGTNATTLSPWINFTDRTVEALFRGQNVSPSSITSAENFGTATLTQPPTRELTGVGGIASAEAIGSPVVTALARIIAPIGFDSEAFGTPTVTNAVVVPSIESGEAFGTHRVRRASDLYLEEGIASEEAFGELVLVHFQELFFTSIPSEEVFGLTEVEDPARSIHPFGIASAEAFGIPGHFNQGMHVRSIDSGEAFGFKRLSVKVAKWQLVQPTKTDSYRLGGPINVIYVKNVRGISVLATGSVAVAVENPTTEQIQAADQVWLGGHANLTEDIAVRDLWLANGFDVEQVY